MTIAIPKKDPSDARELELEQVLADVTARSRRARHADEQDQEGEIALKLWERRHIIDDYWAFAASARHWIRTQWQTRGKADLVKRYGGRTRRAEESLFYDRSKNVLAQGEGLRWSSPDRVDASEVVARDFEIRERQWAKQASGGWLAKRDLTERKVEKVRCYRGIRLERPLEEQDQDTPEEGSDEAADLLWLDCFLARSVLSVEEKSVVAAVQHYYPSLGPGTSEQIASGVRSDGVTAGAIEWRYHSAVRKLHIEIRAAATTTRERYPASVSATFTAAAAYAHEAMHEGKRMALIADHLGFSRDEIRTLGNWSTLGATAVRLHEARKMLLLWWAGRTPKEVESPTALLETRLELITAARTAASQFLGDAQKQNAERLEYLGKHWFKVDCREDESVGCAGGAGQIGGVEAGGITSEELPMSPREPQRRDGATNDPVLKACHEWWQMEHPGDHLAPAEFKLVIDPPEVPGPLTERALRHLEHCAPCREFKIQLSTAWSRGEATDLVAIPPAPEPRRAWWESLSSPSLRLVLAWGRRHAGMGSALVAASVAILLLWLQRQDLVETEPNLIPKGDGLRSQLGEAYCVSPEGTEVQVLKPFLVSTCAVGYSIQVKPGPLARHTTLLALDGNLRFVPLPDSTNHATHVLSLDAFDPERVESYPAAVRLADSGDSVLVVIVRSEHELSTSNVEEALEKLRDKRSDLQTILEAGLFDESVNVEETAWLVRTP